MAQIARQLSTYKESETAAAALKKEIDSLDTDLSKAKNAKTTDFQEQQEKLQDVLTRTTAERDKIKAKKKSAEEAKSAVESERKRVQGVVEGLDASITEEQNSVIDLQGSLAKEEELRSNAATTLETRMAELKRVADVLTKLERERATALNSASRALASDNIRGSAINSSEIRTLDASITTQRTKVSGVESSVKSIAGSLTAAESRILAVQKQIKEGKERLTLLRLRRYNNDSLLAKLDDRLEDIMSGLGHWHFTEEKADKLIDKTNEARREFQGEVEKQVNESEDVKSKSEALKEKKAELGKVEKRMKACEPEIAAAMKKKLEHEKEAADTVKKAETALETAETKLREFLLKEFEAVEFKAELTAIALDAGFDKFRVAEGGTKVKRKITYTGRVPTFENKIATSSLAPRSVPGMCIPEVKFISPGPISKDPQEIEKEEPRTIALIYRDGKPLWPEWPVIPDDAPVLSEDVIELKSSGRDSDTWLQECLSLDELCIPEGGLSGGIKDLVTFAWAGEGKFVNGEKFQHVLWKTPEVPKPDCEKKLN